MNGHTQSSNEDDERVKMFEPHDVGKEPMDACTSVSKDISIAATKCHNGSRIVESICEEKCNTPEGEPTAPGSLEVDQCETNEDGSHVIVDGKRHH